MPQSKLIIEFINGPLDGHVVILNQETVWGQNGKGPLAFPWDRDLGAPQARFYPDDEGWYLEVHTKKPSTLLFSAEKHKSTRITEKLTLEQGMILRASNTWLRINHIENKLGK